MTDDNNGLSATWYELPEGATELKHLIWYKNMNAQVGEAFRALYRLNDCPHSDAIRNLNKVIAYCEQEKERIEMYGNQLADDIVSPYQPMVDMEDGQSM